MMDTVFGSDCSRALELGFEIQADSLHTIADDYHDVQKARLKSDNLKWILARRVPHKYGDRLDINLNQTVDITGALLEARNRSTLSLHDPNNIDDAQLVETKSLSDSSASDYKSDAPIETPQKREDDAELPDIFS